jgi:hypothetical protein
MNDGLLTTDQAAARLGITIAALWHLSSRARKARARGDAGRHLFPEPAQRIAGRIPLYDSANLDRWTPPGRGNRPSRSRGDAMTTPTAMLATADQTAERL